jgi:molecular chaperone DnaK
VPQIEVTFDIDANGIVHVSAKDLGTGKEQKIRIESSSGLSDDEIKRMVKEAEAHAQEDKKEREKAETRNEADNLIYTTEKSLRDYGEKISADDRKNIESAVADLRKVMESDQITEIKAKIEALKQAAYKLAEEVYKTTASQSGDAASQAGEAEGQGHAAGASDSSGNGGGGESGETVEDADYEVVDDENTNKE